MYEWSSLALLCHGIHCVGLCILALYRLLYSVSQMLFRCLWESGILVSNVLALGRRKRIDDLHCVSEDEGGKLGRRLTLCSLGCRK